MIASLLRTNLICSLPITGNKLRKPSYPPDQASGISTAAKPAANAFPYNCHNFHVRDQFLQQRIKQPGRNVHDNTLPSLDICTV